MQFIDVLDKTFGIDRKFRNQKRRREWKKIILIWQFLSGINIIDNNKQSSRHRKFIYRVFS